MNNSLESFLRKHCKLINWSPSSKEIESIKNDIEDAINTGERLSITRCQDIISTHCGIIEIILLDGVDNSDLNTLLVMAMKAYKIGRKDEPNK